MDHNVTIRKVKKLGIFAGFTVALAALAAILEFSGTVDWSGLGLFGPGIGLAVSAGLARAIAWVTKSAPEDFVPKPPDPTP